MISDLTTNKFDKILKDKIIEVQEEPEFQRSLEVIKYATDVPLLYVK